MSKDLAAILILTLITFFAWVGFRGMVLLRKTTQPSFIGKTVEPLNPQLRVDIIEKL